MRRINRVKSDVYTFEKTKILSPIFYLIAYALAFALQVAFLLFQISNKIITLWNIFPTALMAGIFVFVMKSVIADYKSHNKKNNKTNEYNYDDEYDNKPKRPSYTDNAKVISNKRTPAFILVQIFIMIAAFALSYLFYTIHDNKVKDLTLVDCVVVSQWGKTTTTTESDRNGTTTTQTAYVEVTVEYEFNGEKKEAIISGSTTDKIYVEDLKIYIDAEGEFVSDYGRVLVWQVESIILFAFGVFLLLILIFNLGTESFASAIFMVISFAITALIASQFVENFLYNDLSCFISTFANISIYMMLMTVFNILFGKKINKDEKSNSNLNYAGAGAIQSQNEEPQELTYNDFLEDPNSFRKSSYSPSSDISNNEYNNDNDSDDLDFFNGTYNNKPESENAPTKLTKEYFDDDSQNKDFSEEENSENIINSDSYSSDYSNSESYKNSDDDNYSNDSEYKNAENEEDNYSDESVCPNCSSPVSKSDRFCQECGTRL